MMVFEYMFDSSGNRRPPPEWPGWDKARRTSFFPQGYPLIPQGLGFLRHWCRNCCASAVFYAQSAAAVAGVAVRRVAGRPANVIGVHGSKCVCKEGYGACDW